MSYNQACRDNGHPMQHGWGPGRGQPHNDHYKGGGKKQRTFSSPSEVQVLTNFFDVNLRVNDRHQAFPSSKTCSKYYTYSIEWKMAVRKKRDDGNWSEDGNNFYLMPKPDHKKTTGKIDDTTNRPSTADKRFSELARCIIEELKRNLWDRERKILAVSCNSVCCLDKKNQTQFNKMKEHGMELPINVDLDAIVAVTAHCNDGRNFQVLRVTLCTCPVSIIRLM